VRPAAKYQAVLPVLPAGRAGVGDAEGEAAGDVDPVGDTAGVDVGAGVEVAVGTGAVTATVADALSWLVEP
jgi:hypothetical protein